MGYIASASTAFYEPYHIARKFASLDHISGGRAALIPSFGDLSGYPLDGPVPPPLAQTNSVKSAHERHQRPASGHHAVIGTPASIADEMEDRFVHHGCDGWNILPACFPAPVEDVFDPLMPELQRRGLFHAEYAGTPFRENLGLARPPHPSKRAASPQE